MNSCDNCIVEIIDFIQSNGKNNTYEKKTICKDCIVKSLNEFL